MEYLMLFAVPGGEKHYKVFMHKDDLSFTIVEEHILLSNDIHSLARFPDDCSRIEILIYLLHLVCNRPFNLKPAWRQFALDKPIHLFIVLEFPNLFKKLV